MHKFRTFFPLLALHSPAEYAQIVDTYIDGWRKDGWMPECRANNLPGWTQGGSYYFTFNDNPQLNCVYDRL